MVYPLITAFFPSEIVADRGGGSPRWINMEKQQFLFKRNDKNDNDMDIQFGWIIKETNWRQMNMSDMTTMGQSIKLRLIWGAAGLRVITWVKERLGHGSIAVILDTYSHVVSGLQETALQRFEGMLDRGTLKLLVNPDLPRQNVGKGRRVWVWAAEDSNLQPAD